MTTVVARETRSGVEFASDSQTSWGMHKIMGTNKVFANGQVVFGEAGSVRGGDVLRYMKVPKFNESIKGVEVDRWVYTKLIPAISKALQDGQASVSKDGETWSGNHFIAAVGGRAYYISGDFAVVRDPSGIYGIGSGSQFAIGAIAAGATLKEAVTIAAKLDSGTGGKVNVAAAKDLIA